MVRLWNEFATGHLADDLRLKGPEDYKIWRKHMTNLLKYKGLYGLAEFEMSLGPSATPSQIATWNERDANAEALILNNITEGPMGLVEDITGANKVWEALEQAFSDNFDSQESAPGDHPPISTRTRARIAGTTLASHDAPPPATTPAGGSAPPPAAAAPVLATRARGSAPSPAAAVPARATRPRVRAPSPAAAAPVLATGARVRAPSPATVVRARGRAPSPAAVAPVLAALAAARIPAYAPVAAPIPHGANYAPVAAPILHGATQALALPRIQNEVPGPDGRWACGVCGYTLKHRTGRDRHEQQQHRVFRY